MAGSSAREVGLDGERYLAILFADVSGSTALYEKLGDRAALDAVDSVLDLLRRAVSRYQGRVIKTIGDEIMAVFPDADAALQAASEMQLKVTALPSFGETRLAIRIGFHFGAVLEEAADVFGDAVNTAARMAGLANGGQIMTSEQTVAAMSPLLRQSTRSLHALPVKGKQGEISVCEVMWRQSDDVTQMHRRDAAPAVADPMLRIEHAGRSLHMDAKLTALSLGRDTTNDLVIGDRMASRLHGKIERRRDKYYYTDLSSNGTYIAIEGDVEIVLRREQVPLRGRGRISCGHSTSDADAEIVAFFCD